MIQSKSLLCVYCFSLAELGTFDSLLSIMPSTESSTPVLLDGLFLLSLIHFYTMYYSSHFHSLSLCLVLIVRFYSHFKIHSQLFIKFSPTLITICCLPISQHIVQSKNWTTLIFIFPGVHDIPSSAIHHLVLSTDLVFWSVLRYENRGMRRRKIKW